MQPWKRIEPTKVTKVGWRSVVSKTFLMPDGKIAVFDTFHEEGKCFAGVIALTESNRVIVARQYRPGPEKIMDELPGGAVNEGEDPELAMRRELAEETGYEPTGVEYLGVSTRDAFTNAEWYYYLATGCRKTGGGQKLDDNEFVEVRLVSISELLETARNDGLTDPAAILMAYDKLKQIQEEAYGESN